MENVWIVLAGLILGSFINAFLWRFRTGQAIFWARSQCVHCSHKLGFGDLLPLASFLRLKGKCRYCRRKISWQYPLVELAAGAGLWLIHNQQFSLAGQVWLSGWFLLGLTIFLYDFRYFLIPDSFVAAGLVWLAVGLLLFGLGSLGSGFVMGLAISVFFYALYFFSRGVWIGGGDVKLGFLIGLWLGWPLGLWGLFWAYILGAGAGLFLMIFKKATLKSQVPFGPFLILGSWLAYFWGYRIINWYAGLFF